MYDGLRHELQAGAHIERLRAADRAAALVDTAVSPEPARPVVSETRFRRRRALRLGSVLRLAGRNPWPAR